MKKVYELSNEEVELIENWRKGKAIFDGDLWMKLSQKESEAVELWRKIEFGVIAIRFCQGEPIVSKVELEFRRSKVKERRQGTLSIMPHLKDKYG